MKNRIFKAVLICTLMATPSMAVDLTTGDLTQAVCPLYEEQAKANIKQLEQEYSAEASYFQWIQLGLLKSYLSENSESLKKFFEMKKSVVNTEIPRLAELKKKHKKLRANTLKFISTERKKVEDQITQSLGLQKDLLLDLEKSRDEKTSADLTFIETAEPILAELKQKKIFNIEKLYEKSKEIDELIVAVDDSTGREKKRLELALDQKIKEKNNFFDTEIQQVTLDVFYQDTMIKRHKKSVEKYNAEFAISARPIQDKIEDIARERQAKLDEVAAKAKESLDQLLILKTQMASSEKSIKAYKAAEILVLNKNLETITSFMNDGCNYANLFSTSEEAYSLRFGPHTGSYEINSECLKRSSVKVSDDGMLTLCHGMPLLKTPAFTSKVQSYQFCQNLDLTKNTDEMLANLQFKMNWLGQDENGVEKPVDLLKLQADPLCNLSESTPVQQIDNSAVSTIPTLPHPIESFEEPQLNTTSSSSALPIESN